MRRLLVTEHLYLLFVLLLIRMDPPIDASWPKCTKKGCVNFQKIIGPEKVDISLNRTTSIGKIVSLGVDTVSVKYVHISVQFRKCSYFPLMNNTDCEKWTIEDIDVKDQSEKEETFSKMQCLLGKTCVRGGDCYGSNAYFCTARTRNRWSSISDNKALDDETPWENVFHDTCEMHWKCKIGEEKLVIHVTKQYDGLAYYIDPNFATKNRQKLRIYPAVTTWQFIDPFTVKVAALNEVERSSKVSCFFSKDNKVCILKEDSQELPKNSVFYLDNDCLGRLQSALIHVPCPSNDYNGHLDSRIKSLMDDSHNSTSLADTVKVILLTMYETMQSHYNAVVLAQEVHELKLLILKMIHASSATNEHYLGAFLGSPSTTLLMPDGTFLSCPCKSNSLMTTSNCDFANAFHQGVIKERTEDIVCVDKGDFQVVNKNLSLYNNNLTLSLEEPVFPQLFGSEGERAIKDNDFDYSPTPTQAERGDTIVLPGTFTSLISGLIYTLKEGSWIAAYVSLGLWFYRLLPLLREERPTLNQNKG